MREKQFVDSVVENITSAVVSISQDGRLLMLNRAAAELLDVEVGASLEDLLGRGLPKELEAVVRRRPSGIERATASFVQGDDEHDWAIVWVPVPGAGDPAPFWWWKR